MASSSPFSDSDITNLLTEEKSCSTEEGWKLSSKNEFSEIWKRSHENESINLVKAFLQFPGIPPSTVLELVTNTEVRKEWDKDFPVIDVVEEFPDYKIIYWQAKMPTGVTNRDLLQYVWVKKDDTSDDTWYIVYHHLAEHPKVPEKKGFIRAETIFSGMIIRASESDPNSTRLSMLVQNDFKGIIPKFVVNMATVKSPEQWRQSLTDYYHHTYSQRK